VKLAREIATRVNLGIIETVAKRSRLIAFLSEKFGELLAEKEDICPAEKSTASCK